LAVEVRELAVQIVPDRLSAGDSGVHYDVPPRIFELLLDPSMNYSSGIYVRGDETLAVAQIAKMDRIAGVLDLRDGSRVLDVGCGWGGPACYFAQRYGCEVTGVTLSSVQRDFALNRGRSYGVRERLRVDVSDVLDMDYEDESFEAIVFLESIIHMPEKTQIFDRCRSLLTPGGLLFVQESNYARGSRVDEYRQHRGFVEVNTAFGGTGTMVSAGEMLIRLEESGLVPNHLEDISHHYQRTLAQWLDNLDSNATQMCAISAAAHTMLRRYLMIALHTYRTGKTVCHQMSARKPK
jgi:cyclopropane-fatty-acyl-phospholipid synthase